MTRLVRDIRYAARALRRSPGFSLVAVLTLALGIGGNTAIFSVVNAVLLRPLPYEQPDQLVVIHHRYPSLELDASVSAGGYRDYRDHVESFADVAAQSGWGATLTGDGEPVRITGTRVTSQFFTVLGISPIIGRAFTAEEDAPGNQHVVIISNGLWQQQFGSDPQILGRTVVLNSEPYTIVGVMPPGFRDFGNRNAELWVPLALTEEQYARGRTNEWLFVTARLRAGVTLENARREMTQFAEQLKQGTPDQYPPDWTLKLVSFDERATGAIRPAMYVLLGAVGFVLLIACANVANLLLARAAGRMREIALRMALGATRGQLVQQLLAESTMLALAGGVAGAFLAWGALRALTLGLDVPRLLGQTVSVDGSVLLFTGVLSILTGMAFGLAPALQTTRTDMHDTLREGGRGAASDRTGHLVRRTFVVAEFGLALTLLAGAGLLLKSFARLQAVDPGFDPDNLLTAGIVLPTAKYPNEMVQVSFVDRVLTRIESVPGVVAAGATSVLPFSGGWSTGSFSVEGYAPPPGTPGPWGDIRLASAGFANTMRIPLLRGRFIAETDGPGAPTVVVVDEELASRYWPDADPIGKRITWGDPSNPDARWMEVVGVVGHAAHEGLDAERRVQLYLSFRQFPDDAFMVAIRTQGRPSAHLAAIRAAVREVDPDVPLSNVATMDELIDRSVGQRKMATALLGVFAAIGLLLAATGIYGVMSYHVSQRAQEIGVRIALGAAHRDVLSIVMKQGMVLAGIGTGLGILGALGLTRLVQGQLFGVASTDPTTFVSVTVLLIAIAALATLVPAWRATRVDPVESLRQE